jgi:signal transduction histidine kinase
MAKMKKRSNSIEKKTSSTFTRAGKVSIVPNWIVSWRWWVLILAAFLILFLEAYDFTRKLNDSIHIIEFAIFLILLLVIGLLLIALSQGIRNQNRIIRILEAKDNLSLELSGYIDWDVLVDQIARFPRTLATVSQSCLYVSNLNSKKFDLVAQWSRAGTDPTDACANGPCLEWLNKGPAAELKFGQCESESVAVEAASQADLFCLPIKDSERLLGVLQFILEPGESPTGEQVDIFSNIGDEITIALKNGQDRKIFYDMLASETALAERRSVSQYLHDHLGQNLGYLHIKLDQLITQRQQLSLEKVLNDLEMMRNAANDSYKIMRGVLESLHPETTMTLTNLLLEHAKKISLRANFEMDFQTKGKPYPFPQDVQSAIFFAFEELLSNIEKHARADKIAILAEWGRDDFTLTIQDNGIGFAPESVHADQHFGLEILNDRMVRINGRINFTTLENSGTTVKIQVPNLSLGQLGAAN